MRQLPDEMGRRGTEATDAELVARAVGGEGQAFAELVGRHQRAIYPYLARRAGTASAPDLLAEVWIEAYRCRGSFDARRPSARPWLFGIARNVLRSHWRHTLRPVAAPAERPDDPRPEVDARLDAAVLAGQLGPAVLALPGEQKEVLLLAAWEGLSPKEIAQVLGIPPGTARSHLHRARRALIAAAGALADTHPEGA